MNININITGEGELVIGDIGRDEDHSLLQIQVLDDSTVNWEMEYRHISLTSPNNSKSSEKMDVCNSDTPHSKMFTSQRKRLSDSFKNDEDEFNKENEPLNEDVIKQNRKLFRNSVTDAGYQTATPTHYDNSLFSMHVFSSTPSKKQK